MFAKFRPVGGRPTDDPFAWWSYGIRAVQKLVKEKKKKRGWEYISQRRTDRISYISLYKKFKKNDSEDQNILLALEKKLPYDDIILYRKLANASIMHEKKKRG
jgi:vacuolar protein sorting-associated protein 13A/C